MCDYCNKIGTFKDNKSMYKNKYWNIFVNYNKDLEINCDFESDNEIDIKINYCPMCGRKL